MGSLCPGHPSQPEMQLHLRCALWQDPSMEKGGGTAPLWGLGGTGKSGCHTTSGICDLLSTELGLFPLQSPFPPALSALTPMSLCLHF